jgi:hypothetical protein
MSEQGNGNTLLYRVSQLERDLERFEARYEERHRELVNRVIEIKEQVAVLQTQFTAHTKAVNERLDQLEGSVDEDVKGLRRVLVGSALTVIVGAIGFAITSLTVLGGPG